MMIHDKYECMNIKSSGPQRPPDDDHVDHEGWGDHVFTF